MRSIQLPGCVLLCSAWLPAQSPNALIAGSQAMQNQIKTNILRSAEKVPEDLWSFKPVPEVRSMGQIFAHIADGQYEFCGAATEDKSAGRNVEKTAKTKAEITDALKQAFAYCDAAYTKLTPESATGMADFFGRKMPRISIMDFNVAHNSEHYGNLVTYMRIKGIVPPSSEPRK